MSKYYSRIRIHHTPEKEEPVSARQPAPVCDSGKVCLPGIPSVNQMRLAQISDTIPATEKRQTTSQIDKTIVKASIPVILKKPPERTSIRKPTGKFWKPFLMILLLLLFLALFGYLIYLIGVFAFGLALSLLLCILIFIGMITLLSGLFALVLYLWGLLLFSFAHSYGRKVPVYK